MDAPGHRLGDLPAARPAVEADGQGGEDPGPGRDLEPLQVAGAISTTAGGGNRRSAPQPGRAATPAARVEPVRAGPTGAEPAASRTDDLPTRRRQPRPDGAGRADGRRSSTIDAMAALTDAQKALVDKRIFATVTTLNRDGSPQSTPVWVDHDGVNLRFNTARGRLKERNLRRDPRLSVVLVDPDDPYRGVLTVRGRAQLTEEGADEHIDRLAQKYLGQERYPWRQPGDVRVTVTVLADRVGGNV